MESVLRMAIIYVSLLLLFRFSGRRTLAQMDTFDLVLALIISEATQQAILGEDYSLTNALITIATVIFLAITFTAIKQRFTGFEKFAEDTPMVIVQDGVPDMKRMDVSRVGLDELMQEARMSEGIERLDQIKWAILERNGALSIIPK